MFINNKVIEIRPCFSPVETAFTEGGFQIPETMRASNKTWKHWGVRKNVSIQTHQNYDQTAEETI